MNTFKNLEEIKQYYNENTNTYEFVENKQLLHVELTFDLSVASNIHAADIKAADIKAWNINAGDINARNINARNINAWNINARNINAYDIKAQNINACDINAFDINAFNIDAYDIIFEAVCFARETFVCKSIKGQRDNNKYFCLDSDVVIKNENS